MPDTPTSAMAMTPARIHRILRIAAVCGLVGLALMVWALFDPRPLVLVVGMSLGQAIGTLSFLLYGLVVIADLWRGRRAGDGDAESGDTAAAVEMAPDTHAAGEQPAP